MLIRYPGNATNWDTPEEGYRMCTHGTSFRGYGCRPGRGPRPGRVAVKRSSLNPTSLSPWRRNFTSSARSSATVDRRPPAPRHHARYHNPIACQWPHAP